MALISKASLLMVPSTYEPGTLYNVLPSGNRAPDSTDQNSGYDQTRADFDFDRGSNTAATRVNSDGLIEKYRENLLLHSGNLTESEWENIRTTDTSGHTGYDGTANAYKIIPTTATNTHRIDYVDTWTTGLVYAFSFYAKSDGYDTIDVVIGGSSIGNDYGRFNLSTGTASNVGTSIAASMQDVGNGWYRCQTTQVSGSTTRINIAVNDGTTQSYAGDGTSGVLIQHPQLESGLVSTDYLSSTDVTGKAGVLVDLPRINYDANGENGALLLEPSRANKTEHAEYFEGWSRVNTGVAILDANAYTSPEGLQNAYKLTFTASGGSSQIYKVLNGFTIGTKYTQSLYVKYISGSGENFQIVKSFGTAGVRCTFTNGGADLSVIAVGGTQANDFGKEPLGNGWFRIWFAYASNTTNWEVNISRNSGTGSDVYAIYGHQIEEGNYVSSYIPTMGTSETRAADSCSVTGASDVIGQTEGTLFLDLNPLEFADASRYLSIESSSGAGSGWIGIFAASPDIFRIYGDGFDSNFGGYSVGDRAKIALTYKNGVATNIYINGVNKGSVTANTTGKNYSILKLGYAIIGGVGAGEFNQCTIFSTALSDSELATLTTL